MNTYPSDKQVERYHKLRNQIKRLINNDLRKGGVVYGNRAINSQVPQHLRTHTEGDFDVYVENPKARK